MTTVKAALADAKLPAEDFFKSTYKLCFGSGISESSDVKFIEVDSSTLSNLNSLEELQLKGGPEEIAIMCSRERSFEIKEAETSNSLLFVSGDIQIPKSDDHCSDFEATAVDVTYLSHNYFEMTPCAPKLNQIFRLLASSLYKGEIEEKNVAVGTRLYTVADVVESVQASYSEVVGCLANIGAFSLHGKIRLLDFDFCSEMMLHIIQLCLENSWNWSNVPTAEVIQQLSTLYLESVLNHVLAFYSNSDPEWHEEDRWTPPVSVALDCSKVSRMIGEMILRSGTKFRLSDFLESWRQAIPKGFEPKLADLEGIAIIDNAPQSKAASKLVDLSGTIWFIDRLSLPDLFESRLDKLFGEKVNWSIDELAPFFKDLQLEKAALSSLLAKHARSLLQNGSRVYTRKQI